MGLWSKLLWSLLLTGLLVVASRSQEAASDDFEVEDEAIEDQISTEETVPATEPMERPVYKKPVIKGNLYFLSTFEDPSEFASNWRVSTAKKDGVEENIAKYDGKWGVEEPKDNPLIGDLGLVLKSQAKHHATAAKLDRPFKFTTKSFVVQYEVKFQNSQDCGGAYIKLLTEDPHLELSSFHDKTPYTVMFGPDKCGNDHKLHFIFRHKNPLKGTFEEKHAKKPSGDLSSYFSDKKTHLYTLVVNPDNTFEVYVDQNMVNSGSLLEDFEPAVNPPKEIVDPNDKKPADWDEREKIPDPEAAKPEDWDEDQPELIPDKDAVKPDNWLEEEPELIPDPEAEKPSDWDEDMDGEWEAPSISNPACENAAGCGEWTPPLIKNPAYKGKWRAPMIDNPLYKGKWTPRNIPNPDFFEDLEPFKMSTINAVGLELWSMSNDIYFDNFLIADDKDVADEFATQSWELKHQQELLGGGAGKSVVQAVMDATKERPWLWAVFIVVVILPVVLVIAYCCMPGAKTDDAAQTKKTDEPVPDDEADKKADEKADKAQSEGAGDSKDDSKKKASKSALEAEEEEEEDADDEEDSSVAAEADRRTSPRRRKTKPQKE